MKIRRNKDSGSALLVMLVITSILGVALASYVTLASVQKSSVVRSQCWNAIIPVCEGGIEDGMAHINDSAIGTNFALNGWTITNNSFRIARTLGDGRYVVSISTDSLPVLVAKAYLTNPITGQQIARSVRVTTTHWATGMKGIVARNNLSMTSNTQVDSFDSEDARYSTDGHYDSSKRKDGGFAGSVLGNVTGATIYGSVATGPNGSASGNVGDFGWISGSSGIEPGHYANDLNLAFPVVQAPFSGGGFAPSAGSVTLTNYDFWVSKVTSSTYPTNAASGITTNDFGTTTVTTYPSGVLASTITTNTTSTKSKTMPAAGTYLNLTSKGAWYYYDAITSYTYPIRTYTYSLTATNSSPTTETYDYVLNSDRYQLSSLSMSGNQRLIVTTNSVLYITGDLSMTGNSEIIVAPGASLKLFVAGNASLAGNGVINYTQDASTFMYYGLPSNTSISYTGNASFTGVIYAPQADLQLGGGGNNVYDVVGAVMANTVSMNGHFNFHYDERLGRSQVQSKYTAASWEEITWSEF